MLFEAMLEAGPFYETPSAKSVGKKLQKTTLLRSDKAAKPLESK